MKATSLAIAAIAISCTSPALAQNLSSDVRCLLLSNFFAKGAKEEAARQAAAQSMIFFAGRLDGHADVKAIAGEMRSQSKMIDPNKAGAEMGGCAARMGQAQKTIQDAAKSLTTK